jgi:hypothetical protein
MKPPPALVSTGKLATGHRLTQPEQLCQPPRLHRSVCAVLYTTRARVTVLRWPGVEVRSSSFLLHRTARSSYGSATPPSSNATGRQCKLLEAAPGSDIQCSYDSRHGTFWVTRQRSTYIDLIKISPNCTREVSATAPIPGSPASRIYPLDTLASSCALVSYQIVLMSRRCGCLNVCFSHYGPSSNFRPSHVYAILVLL